MANDVCECTDRGIVVPDGYTCGNPDCYRTKAAEAAIGNIAKALINPSERSGDTTLPRQPNEVRERP